MANSYLTPTAVTRAIAAILHQKGNFINRINQQYDAQYADNGQRKGGGSIKIRMPNQYTVRTGTTMNVQQTAETSETLTIGTMKGVDLAFADTDLALSIEDFSKRFLEPAVAVLVSAIEADVITGCVNGVGNMIDHDGTALAYSHVLEARQRIMEMLAPDNEEELSLFLSPTHLTKFAAALSGLYYNIQGPSETNVYRNASLKAPVAGVGWVGNSTHLTDLTTGTALGGSWATTTGGESGWLADVAGSEALGVTASTGIHIDTTTTTWKKGEVFSIEGVYAVHPETKASLGRMQQFAVAADNSDGAETDLVFASPTGGDAGIVYDYGGARQNVYTNAGGTIAAARSYVNNKKIYKWGGGASATINRSVYFHKDFAVIAFADLENPSRYGAWGSTEVVDDISVRLWRQGDILNGQFPCRLDVLYGYKVIRPQLACRIHADG